MNGSNEFFNVSSCQFEWNMFSQIKLMEMIVSGEKIQKHLEETISGFWTTWGNSPAPHFKNSLKIKCI